MQRVVAVRACGGRVVGLEELALDFQRALIPRWTDVNIESVLFPKSYQNRLAGAAKALKERDLAGLDLSAWLLPAEECASPLGGYGGTLVIGPLWAWLLGAKRIDKPGMTTDDKDAIVSAFRVLMRTGCGRPRVLNSCDERGRSLLMCAAGCDLAFRLLHTQALVDWTHETLSSSTISIGDSLLGEAISTGDLYGVYALTRLSDEELTHCVRPGSRVMARLLSSSIVTERMQTLKELARRTDVTWPHSFPLDEEGLTLAASAMRRTRDFWDIFSNPASPWHAAFLNACEDASVVTDEFTRSDPLRAASMSVPPRPDLTRPDPTRPDPSIGVSHVSCV
jgi:hypothetical protein